MGFRDNEQTIEASAQRWAEAVVEDEDQESVAVRRRRIGEVKRTGRVGAAMLRVLVWVAILIAVLFGLVFLVAFVVWVGVEPT